MDFHLSKWKKDHLRALPLFSSEFFGKYLWNNSFNTIFFGKEEGRIKGLIFCLWALLLQTMFTWAISQVVGLLCFKDIFLFFKETPSFPPPHLLLIGFPFLLIYCTNVSLKKGRKIIHSPTISIASILCSFPVFVWVCILMYLWVITQSIM